jgi:transposase
VTRAAEQDRPDVRQKRAAFRTRAAGVDPQRFVFVDESGANTAMARLYGRGPVGERVVGTVPAAHWQATTLVSAIRADGLAAPLVFEGATDEAAFLTYVREVLVLDNLAAHRVPAVARLLRKAGAGVWYLPPYSPDLNPIEKVWAKVKAWLRKAAARTTEALWAAIGAALAAVTPEDCRGCVAACGYHATPVREAL